MSQTRERRRRRPRRPLAYALLLAACAVVALGAAWAAARAPVITYEKRLESPALVVTSKGRDARPAAL